MALKIKNTKKKLSLCIDGDFTIYSVEEYRKSIAKRFNADQVLEVDLSEVEDIDTSGLQLLAAMDKQCSDSGTEMMISAASTVAQEAIDAICLVSNLKMMEGCRHEFRRCVS